MITRRTRIQLAVFALITMVGVSFVGARYARLDRLVIDDSYDVIVHLADSGGIFAGAEVSYRGVRVGQVDRLVLTRQGVDAVLAVEKGYDDIPADTVAVVGNRSAVGEQYVELQPRSDQAPHLTQGSEIAVTDTRLPISTTTLLTHLSETVSSVDHDDLRTVVSELGLAFAGTGEALGTIIDTSNAFIAEANANFDVTTALLTDGNTVLRTQVASESSIREFARAMSLFSGTLAGSDKDLRRLIDSGSAAAGQLKQFLDDNQVEISDLVNNLVTTGQVVVRNLDGVEQILVVYPYVVEGGFTVVGKNPATGQYDAHFGLVLTEEPPLCRKGYDGTRHRAPSDGSDPGMNEKARCLEPASVTNARGAQHAPRPPAHYPAPVAAVDPATGSVTWDPTEIARLTASSGPPPATLGKESWKWLYLAPLLPQTR